MLPSSHIHLKFPPSVYMAAYFVYDRAGVIFLLVGDILGTAGKIYMSLFYRIFPFFRLGYGGEEFSPTPGLYNVLGRLPPVCPAPGDDQDIRKESSEWGAQTTTSDTPWITPANSREPRAEKTHPFRKAIK